MLLLDQLRTRGRDIRGQNEVRQHALGVPLVVRPERRIGRRPARTGRLVRQVLGKPVGDHVVLALALLRDHRLHGASKADLVAERAGTHEVQQEIGARHGAFKYGRSAHAWTD